MIHSDMEVEHVEHRKLSFRVSADVAQALEHLSKRNCNSVGAELRRACLSHLAQNDVRNDDDRLCEAGRARTSADGDSGYGTSYR